MKRVTFTRHGLGGGLAALLCAISLAVQALPDGSEVSDIVQRGYVLTDFRLVTPGAGPNDCPDGFNLGYSQRFLAALPEAERQPYLDDPQLLQQALAPWYYDDPEQDPCANPANFPDTGMLTIDGPLAMQRMEADGSISETTAPPSACPAASAANEARTIDNQYWRVMGCVRGYQPTGQAAAFANSFITDGSMTVLLQVTPLDEDSGAVEVLLASSQTPVTLGTNGAPLPWASLPLAADTRYHNRVRGQLDDGVLVTERFDLRIIRAAQRLDSELYLRDAMLRLEIDPDTGNASGLLAGYWDLDSLAHSSIRIQDRTGLSSGKPAADTHGYTCPGKYYAVKRLADGNPDPATGECTSISVLHSLQAVPAFVVANP
ncbi:hypothetical protein [Parahaliea mediterranea]|uniref:hypothetical protein n=1 Tax=Parahaliea mediterranea TaxID=651086 RepID=UPI00130034A1|nr:hypothetical protein [Parahaliea mediterranea]